ncbi:hypothetical protein WA1_04605 [Scytonema hofmannii PCC 7110]|uniref:Uncharacterized protein n=1 Tax=Scytonema hofmannii PCC 7110 TaxID=128403 RepID=A0A139WZA4_9CYAN|nr:hypothetical protein [Scytonema hofmannii]KYC37797.1 hypothetical protein WA1_04605 [Scytonema hofmannii PCC 7110]
MTSIELKNHPVWHDLSEILQNIDANTLAKEHLSLCNYKVCGYWDEQDKYYEEITLPRTLEAELTSSSIGITHNKRFLQLKFILTVSRNGVEDNLSPNNRQSIGDLELIYDENLEFIDENWQLDIDSPYLDIQHALQE